MVGLGRFELPTSPLSGVRSNQLSYRPEVVRARCAYYSELQPWRILRSQLWKTGNLCGHSRPAFDPDLRFAYSLKEVIQPHVPVRLPCYDFTPVISHTVVSALPRVKLPTSGATYFHGVTGGVYKTRERIHRDILIRDY